MMLDATKSTEQRRLLEIELDAVGIRLNKRKPDVVVKRKTTGGVSYCFSQIIMVFLTHVEACSELMSLYPISEVIDRESRLRQL